ncbi:MAG TPA: RyR domain-containing protein [Terriglobales bacterium]|jgi:ryanodine receptor 2|nr:RyR domain-containing protein [Terriglobales bacterium]
MNYMPQPVDTSSIELSRDIVELTERLAENTHEVWARERMAQGWTFGRERNDARKQHPSLIPYKELPESEKIYDRNTAIQTLKAVTAFGYRISKA